MSKIYYSVHDVPYTSDSYQQSRSPVGFRFSRTEIVHITIAMIVLTLAFSFALVPGYPLRNISIVINYIPLSFLAIATAFFCHELMHKYVGMRYGYWSEFRMFPQGLFFAFIFGLFFGIVFAAPGAVQIFGYPSKEESGKISVAGPAINLCIAAVTFPIAFILQGFASSMLFFISYINAFLAFFNLIPFGPLDGRKIMAWRMDIWIVLLLISLSLIVLSFIYY